MALRPSWFLRAKDFADRQGTHTCILKSRHVASQHRKLGLLKLAYTCLHVIEASCDPLYDEAHQCFELESKTKTL